VRRVVVLERRLVQDLLSGPDPARRAVLNEVRVEEFVESAGVGTNCGSSNSTSRRAT
jgi:hypothetical protein